MKTDARAFRIWAMVTGEIYSEIKEPSSAFSKTGSQSSSPSATIVKQGDTATCGAAFDCHLARPYVLAMPLSSPADGS